MVHRPKINPSNCKKKHVELEMEEKVNETTMNTQVQINQDDNITCISGNLSSWYSGFTSSDSLFKSINELVPSENHNFSNIKFVGANTSDGIYKPKEGFSPNYLFDTTKIKDMRICEYDTSKLHIGAGCTITMLLKALRNIETMISDKDVSIITEATNNIERVASTIIRNIGSIGGNLAMVPVFGFLSDLLNSLYILGCILEIHYFDNNEIKIIHFNIPEYLLFMEKHPKRLFLIVSLDINIDDILSMNPIGIGCYKIAKRLELSHAIINGGCLIGEQDKKLKARIGFTIPPKKDSNSISFHFYTKTIELIESMELPITIEKLKDINNVFNDECESFSSNQEINIILKIFDKFLIQIYHKNINSNGLVSNIDLLDVFRERRTSTSSGEQKFNVYRQEASQPRVKSDALLQAQGYAYYTWNNPNLNRNVLHGNFLLSKKGFKPFQINIEKIKKLGVHIITAEMACKTSGDNAIEFELFNDKIGDDLYIQINDNEPFIMPGSRWIAKDYIQYCGQPIALLLSDDETKLANTITRIQNNHEEYVSYKGECKLIRKLGNSNEFGPVITNTPVVSIEESSEKGLTIKPKRFFVTKVTSPNIDFQNPSIDWNSFKDKGYDIIEGTAETGSQIHMYMEPQSCIAEPMDHGGIRLLSSTQSPRDLQAMLADMLHVPRAQIVIQVIRLGGGFGGKTIQCWATAAAATMACKILKRQVRVALDRNTDMSITGVGHAFKGKYIASYDKSGEFKGLQINFQSQAGYSADCSVFVNATALSVAFNTYHFPSYFVDGKIFYTNTVSATAFRGYGVPQAMFVTESAIENIADKLTVQNNPQRFKSLENYKNYQREIYKRRFELRKLNFLKNGQSFPFASKPLENVLSNTIWEQSWPTYSEWFEEAIDFNCSSLTKKMGVGIMPILYPVSFNYPRFMQGEASISIKTDGCVILVVGCVDMGQGLFIKLKQLVAEKLRIPSSFIYIAEVTTDCPPNQIGTGASVATELNGAALLKAAALAYDEFNNYCESYWNVLTTNPESMDAKLLFNGNTEIQKIFLECTTKRETGCYKYPSLWIPKNIASSLRKCGEDYENNPTPDNLEKLQVAQTIFEKVKKERNLLWSALCDQLECSRATLLFSAHSNVDGIDSLNGITGKGDQSMYELYASAICQVELDMQTGDINFKKAKIIFDAGESLNPAIDIGQIEGAFIQGCGYMTSEEVEYDNEGQITNSTWEYKPFLTKSIPQKFIIHLFPTDEKFVDDEYRHTMEYRQKRRMEVHGIDNKSVMSSKSTGEPPIVLCSSFFQAIRDSLRAQQDSLYFTFAPDNVPNNNGVIDFSVAPATVSRIQASIDKIGKEFNENTGNKDSTNFNFISHLQ